ncbi:MAG: hypothetical protein HeimC3_15640 [Candidatus Heimdallarchaeota archaeon LC_3]|nr:MAG: hypothetical protein HeimC3_15640 [Candidatus Heimdallarchaeota archaeon LC_3]
MDNKKKIGYYSGLGSIFSFIFFISIAYLVSLNEYNPLTKTISKLGLTKNGSIYFIIGTTIGGILISIYIGFYLSNILTKTKYNTIGIYLGILSGFALVGVGLIQDKPELVYRIGHTLSSGVFFISMGLAIFFFSLHLKESNSTTLKKLSYFGFFVCSIAVLHFFLSFYKEIIHIFGTEFTINAIWQKITVSAYMVWHILLLLNLNPDK